MSENMIESGDKFSAFDAPPQAKTDEQLERAVTQSYTYLCSRHDKAVSQGAMSVRVNRAELFLILSTFKTLTAGLKDAAGGDVGG